jgi:hypothetical protein
MRAHVLIRERPCYRREAFVAGLRAAGHEVHVKHPERYTADTLLVIWNRYDYWHIIAAQVEKAGGRVLVAENGYVSRGGGTPKFDVYTPAGGLQDHYYAIAEGWHNGGGKWFCGGAERLEALNLELKPWRKGGDILVCSNRSFGVPGRMMPPDWPERTVAKLQKQNSRAVRLRLHPGNNRPARSLESDLEGAGAVVIWSSSAGVHALLHGVPVVCEAPYWICKDATFRSVAQLDTLGCGLAERESALQRMAWAQWTVAEIASGEPFRRLLS